MFPFMKVKFYWGYITLQSTLCDESDDDPRITISFSKVSNQECWSYNARVFL
jgi:hypothetical protein